MIDRKSEIIAGLIAHIIKEWNTLYSTVDRRKDQTDIGCGYVKMNFNMGMLLKSNDNIFFNKPLNINAKEFGVLNGTTKVYIDNNLADFDFDIYWAEGYPFHKLKHIEPPPV